jgi:DNA invertase Pin-like site-specific DNA recombinase
MKWFRDKFTGRTMNRPGMDQLMEQLRAGRLERIVVWRLDRLGRTTKGLCQLFDELTERKVDLVSIKDGFSLSSPAGRLHARILASVAEYETEVRAERVAAGQAVARRNGKKWGGSKKGWRWKVSDAQQTAILEMHCAGRPITRIAHATGLSRPTVYRVLKLSSPFGSENGLNLCDSLKVQLESSGQARKLVSLRRPAKCKGRSNPP